MLLLFLTDIFVTYVLPMKVINYQYFENVQFDRNVSLQSMEIDSKLQCATLSSVTLALAFQYHTGSSPHCVTARLADSSDTSANNITSFSSAYVDVDYVSGKFDDNERTPHHSITLISTYSYDCEYHFIVFR